MYQCFRTVVYSRRCFPLISCVESFAPRSGRASTPAALLSFLRRRRSHFRHNPLPFFRIYGNAFSDVSFRPHSGHVPLPCLQACPLVLVQVLRSAPLLAFGSGVPHSCSVTHLVTQADVLGRSVPPWMNFWNYCKLRKRCCPTKFFVTDSGLISSRVPSYSEQR